MRAPRIDDEGLSFETPGSLEPAEETGEHDAEEVCEEQDRTERLDCEEVWQSRCKFASNPSQAVARFVV